MKSIIGAAVLIADIIAGMAAPSILAGLHKPHPHLTGPVVLYAVLALATLWVIASIVNRGSEKPPAQRPTFSSFRPGR